MKNKLNQHLRSHIITNGYIKLDHFLSLQTHYYYSSHIIGKKADFITSPEISPLFSETIADYIAETWHDEIKKDFSLVELGPGNGTMMFDILKTLKNYPDLWNKISNIFLVETSPLLREVQKKALDNLTDLKSKISWISNINDIETNNLFIISNEFFDALPIKQFCIKNNKIWEICLSIINNELAFSLMPSLFPKHTISKNPFDFIEISPQRSEYIQNIIQKMNQRRCHCLIIDYGYLNSPNTNTLQAIKNHTKIGLFDDIENSDITSLVDFSALINIIENSQNIISYDIMTQAEFLRKWGILEKAKTVNSDIINSQVNRLISRDQMGDLFKVLKFSN